MTKLNQEPVFSADDSLACEPGVHGEHVAAHFHDFGQLRYAASGVLVTTTEAGTWMAPANRIAWVPPFHVHSSRTRAASSRPSPISSARRPAAIG
jgi:hypothetical protein